jgi:hypothetical protein
LITYSLRTININNHPNTNPNPNLNQSYNENGDTTTTATGKNFKKGIKFELYSPRKEFVTPKGNNILTYLSPAMYEESPRNKSNSNFNKSSKIIKLKGIKFDRMRGRCLSDLINPNNFPTPGTYNPNYDFVRSSLASRKYNISNIFSYYHQ